MRITHWLTRDRRRTARSNGPSGHRGCAENRLAGRFLTEDPVRQAPFWSQGLNPYSYVFNDPINHTAPSGFMADGWDATLGITGWGVGAIGGAYLTALSSGGGAAAGIGAPIGAAQAEGRLPAAAPP